MPALGPRCHELRIQDAGATWRIIYRLDQGCRDYRRSFHQENPGNPGIRDRHLQTQTQGLRRNRKARITMRKDKRARLEARGWRFGSAADFLALTSEEAAFVETKLALSRSLRTRRTAKNMSQAALAKRLHSSQSRVAKMEAADPTVSIDLLLRALFALGAQPSDVALAIRKRRSMAA
jgi:ribosome-binding protein aMBF1 (putative translation factor)